MHQHFWKSYCVRPRLLHLVDLEVALVLRRYVRSGEIDPARGQEALHDFADFPITRYSHHPFLMRIWALRDNSTPYDAAYLALAEVLGAPRITRDRHLASVLGHTASIVCL